MVESGRNMVTANIAIGKNSDWTKVQTNSSNSDKYSFFGKNSSMQNFKTWQIISQIYQKAKWSGTDLKTFILQKIK